MENAKKKRIPRKIFTFAFSKADKSLIFIFVCMISLYGGYFCIFHSNDQESHNIDVRSILSDLNDDPYVVHYQKEILITYPSNPSLDSSKAPIVIIIQGSLMEKNVFNLVTSEFLRNGFLIVTQDIDHSSNTFIELNATINFFQNHEKFQHNPLGVFGHSHGAYFASYIGIYRANNLPYVICANMGEISMQAIEFRDLNLPSDCTIIGSNISMINNSYNELIGNSIIPNFLITENIQDSNFEPNINNNRRFLLKSNVSDIDYLQAVNISQFNMIEGNFSNKSARLFYLTNSISGHASFILSHKVFQTTIEWITNSCAWELPHSMLNISIFYFSRIIYLILCTTFAISSSKGFYENLYSQSLVSSNTLNLLRIEKFNTKNDWNEKKIENGIQKYLKVKKQDYSVFSFKSDKNSPISMILRDWIKLHSFWTIIICWLFYGCIQLLSLKYSNNLLEKLLITENPYKLLIFSAFYVMLMTIRAFYMIKETDNLPYLNKLTIFKRSNQIPKINRGLVRTSLIGIYLFFLTYFFIYFWLFLVMFQWLGVIFISNVFVFVFIFNIGINIMLSFNYRSSVAFLISQIIVFIYTYNIEFPDGWNNFR